MWLRVLPVVAGVGLDPSPLLSLGIGLADGVTQRAALANGLPELLREFAQTVLARQVAPA